MDASTDGVVIEVRCNEYTMRDANPHVPWSPDEIAADAVACVAAGAAIVHFHARDPLTGAPSTAVDLYGETARQIRERCDAVVMPTLGAGTLPDPADRVRHIVDLAGDPERRADLAPIDLGTFNLDPYDRASRSFRVDDLVYHNPVRTLLYLAGAINGAGVKPMAALWSVGSVRMLEALVHRGTFTEPVYAQLTLSQTLLSTHPGTVAGMEALLTFLPPDLGVHWSVLSVGGNLLPLVGPAVEAGGHLAIGLGDYPYRELGTPTNAEIVAEVARMLRAMGRRPATPAEARELLALD
jgi:3-keto-5-aminohexanoate cleavage enzyme